MVQISDGWHQRRVLVQLLRDETGKLCVGSHHHLLSDGVYQVGIIF